MKYAYLGPEGTYTHEAAIRFAGEGAIAAFSTIENVFGAVCEGGYCAGVCPIDNVIEGAVSATIDTLIYGAPLYIDAKLTMPINHALLCAAKRPISITAIISHPQALAQCRAFVRGSYPNAETIEAASTAAAARMVRHTPQSAAIAAPSAAGLYGLNILERDISDCNDNETEFIRVSRKRGEPSPGFSAAVAFSTENRPGGLYSVLDIFAIWDVNLIKIISRPVKGRRGEYVFFAELECGASDTAVRDVGDALRMVERKSSFFRYIGAYQTFKLTTAV